MNPIVKRFVQHKTVLADAALGRYRRLKNKYCLTGTKTHLREVSQTVAAFHTMYP
jgi:hypothetical protein